MLLAFCDDCVTCKVTNVCAQIVVSCDITSVRRRFNAMEVETDNGWADWRLCFYINIYCLYLYGVA